MSQRFEGKVAVITGGGSGIGAETCRMFAAEGATVAVVDIDAEAAEAVAGAIRSAEGLAEAFECDVSDWSSVSAMIDRVVARFRRIDVLFNNAGIAPRASVEEMTPELWHNVLAVDLDSVFFVTKAALPHLKAGGGCIVNTGSQCSIAGYPRLAAYTAAKAGVLMLTKQMAAEFRPFGVRVNAVLPGVVATPLQMRAWKEEGKDYGSMDKSRIQQPADIARAVLFFADPANSQISGNFLAVNGVSSFL